MRIPFTDAQLEENPYQPPFYHPGENDPAIQYLQERRRALGGYVPERRSKYTQIALPDETAYEDMKKGSGKQAIATTMAFARLLKDLLRAKDFGHRVVPIIPDEARTFGMDAYFPTAKIYNPAGQHYTSVDRELLLAYKESPQGQIVHVGINEAGAFGAFTAAGTSYATHGEPLIPVYVFYSMFGFQRTGDAMWAAGDQMARGFIMGATAGRTTLTGEGLQHADGHSHLLASTNPAVVSYDPAYGYEIGHIVRTGLERMYGGQHPDPNVMYYLTVYNEPLVQPAEPENLDVDGVVRGIYLLSTLGRSEGPRVQLLASGVAVPWAIEAQALLAQDWGIAADIWSVTSWTELRRDGLAADSHNFLHPEQERRTAYVTQKLSGAEGPFVAVSDFMHAVPDQIRQFVPGDFATLGADDFGFSDTRAAARRYFTIDGPSIVVRALQSLGRLGTVDPALPAQAIEKYRLLRRERRHHRHRGRRELIRVPAVAKTKQQTLAWLRTHLGRAHHGDAEAPRGHAPLVRRHAAGAPLRRRPRGAGRHHELHQLVRRPQVDAVDRGGRVRCCSARAAAVGEPAADAPAHPRSRSRSSRSGSRTASTTCARRSCSTRARSRSPRRMSTPAPPKPAGCGMRGSRRSSSTRSSPASTTTSCRAGSRRSAGTATARCACWSARRRSSSTSTSCAAPRGTWMRMC